VKVHFTGIGGAGMAPLAELLLQRGVEVSGSDIEFNSKCAALQNAGAQIFTGHREENVDTTVETLVFTSAAAEDNPELSIARRRGVKCLRRGEYLAEFAKYYRRVISVSGTHGKSSISALISAILSACGKEPGFMIGAQVAGMPSCSNGRNDDLFGT
jgi:UDP-N-acetylmuramate--alanine ligase